MTSPDSFGSALPPSKASPVGDRCGEALSSAGLGDRKGRHLPKLSIEGVTRWMRSEREPHDCICCDGPHVFCYTVDLEPWPTSHPWQDSAAWLHEAVRRMPEGTRIRITVEVVSDDTSPKPEQNHHDPDDSACWDDQDVAEARLQGSDYEAWAEL